MQPLTEKAEADRNVWSLRGSRVTRRVAMGWLGVLGAAGISPPAFAAVQPQPLLRDEHGAALSDEDGELLFDLDG